MAMSAPIRHQPIRICPMSAPLAASGLSTMSQKRDYREDPHGFSREGLPHSKREKLQHFVQHKWCLSGDASEDTPPKVAKLASLRALIPEFKGTNGEHWQPIYLIGLALMLFMCVHLLVVLHATQVDL